MAQKELSIQLQKLKSRRNHLAKLIATAGPRAPRHWAKELDEIDASISRITSALSKGDKPTDILDTENPEQIHKDMNGLYGRIKVWILLRGGMLLTILLLILVCLLFLKYHLESRKNETELRHINGITITVEYPRFIFCNKDFSILFCAIGQQVSPVGVEIKPKTPEFRIKGGKWFHNFDLSEASRDDWRPSLVCEPNSSLFKRLYQKRRITMIGKDHVGSPFSTQSIKFRMIGFYRILSLAALLIIGVINEIRQRFLRMILQMFRGKVSQA